MRHFERSALIWGSGLDPESTLILLALNEYLGSHETAWPSMNTLAKMTRLSRMTIIRRQEKLEKLKVLVVTRRTKNGFKTSNEYSINWQALGVISVTINPDISVVTESDNDVSESDNAGSIPMISDVTHSYNDVSESDNDVSESYNDVSESYNRCNSQLQQMYLRVTTDVSESYIDPIYRTNLKEPTHRSDPFKPPTPKPESANADRVLAPDPWNSQTAPMPATRKASDPEPSAVEPEPELDVIQGELVEPIPANPLSGQNQGSGKDNSSAANLSKKKKEKFTAEQFNVWWQAVGHKEGKADARKVFLGLSPADVSLETLIEARQAQERWHVEHNGTLQYLKRPPAWLRAEAWDDQMEPVSSAGYSPEAIKQAKHADAIKQRILAKQASQSLR